MCARVIFLFSLRVERQTVRWPRIVAGRAVVVSGHRRRAHCQPFHRAAHPFAKHTVEAHCQSTACRVSAGAYAKQALTHKQLLDAAHEVRAATKKTNNRGGRAAKPWAVVFFPLGSASTPTCRSVVWSRKGRAQSGCGSRVTRGVCVLCRGKGLGREEGSGTLGCRHGREV